MNTYIYFAFIAMVLWGVSDFSMQYFVRKIGRIATLTWVGVFGTIVLFPFVQNDLGIIFNINNFYYLFFLGLLHILSALLLFSAFKYGKLSVVETIMIAELPLTIFLGILFFKETLTFQQTLLAATICCGIVLATLKNSKNRLATMFSKETWIEKGAFFSIGAVLVISLINFFTADNARLSSPLLAIWFPWSIFTISSLAFLILKRDIRRSFHNLKLNWPIVLLMCIANCIAWVTFSLASTKLNFSLLSAISLCYPVIAILLGIFVNKEKLSKMQYFGATVALFCSLLIGLLFSV